MFSFKLSERTVRDDERVSKDSLWRLASLNVAAIAWPIKLAIYQQLFSSVTSSKIIPANIIMIFYDSPK